MGTRTRNRGGHRRRRTSPSRPRAAGRRAGSSVVQVYHGGLCALSASPLPPVQIGGRSVGFATRGNSAISATPLPRHLPGWPAGRPSVRRARELRPESVAIQWLMNLIGMAISVRFPAKSRGWRDFRGRDACLFEGGGSRILGLRGQKCRCHRHRTRPTGVGFCGTFGTHRADRGAPVFRLKGARHSSGAQGHERHSRTDPHCGSVRGGALR
jgi:hypothetical protein